MRGPARTTSPQVPAVAGLAPATTYHYRVVASNAAGAVNGADQTFTTAPAGSGTPSPTAPGGFAGVKLISTALTLKRGFVAVKLSCPAGTAGRCTGVTKLSARRKRTGSRAGRDGRPRPRALLDRRGRPGEAEGARLPPRAAAVRAHAPAPRQGRNRRARRHGPVEDELLTRDDPEGDPVTSAARPRTAGPQVTGRKL